METVHVCSKLLRIALAFIVSLNPIAVLVVENLHDRRLVNLIPPAKCVLGGDIDSAELNLVAVVSEVIGRLLHFGGKSEGVWAPRHVESNHPDLIFVHGVFPILVCQLFGEAEQSRLPS